MQKIINTKKSLSRSPIISECMIENDFLEERDMRSNRKSEDFGKLARMDNLFAIVVDFDNFQCTPSKMFNR